MGLVVQVAAHQPAQIDGAVLIGRHARCAAESVAGHGAVADRAVIPPHQRTHVYHRGAALDQPAALHGALAGAAAIGQQRHVPHHAAGGDDGEHTHVIPRGCKGHAPDDVSAAVIDGPEAAGVAHIRRIHRAVDRRLAGDGSGGTGVCSPPIVSVVNIPLLPERGVCRSRGKVAVVTAQFVQMPGRPQVYGGRRSRAAAGSHGLGKIGVELVRAPVDGHAVVETGVGDVCASGQYLYRVQTIVRPTVGTGEVRGSSSIESLGFAAIRHRKCTTQRRGQRHGVPVAEDGFAVIQIIHVAAEEAHRVVAVPLIVHQRLCLKLRLPVAVVAQVHQARVGIGAQALPQQVIGVCGVGAGRRERSAVQICQKLCRDHLCIAPAACCASDVSVLFSIQTAGQVKHVLDVGGDVSASFGRGVHRLRVAQISAGAVRIGRLGQIPSHEARCAVCRRLIPGGVAVA